jgi:peptide/nickel transport system substrate-binding protein
MVLAPILTACGGGVTTPTSTGTPRQGGTLIIGATEEPDFLNPVLWTLATAYDVGSAFDDPLVAIDDKGGFAPRLATSWSNSADGLTYTVLTPSAVDASGCGLR